MAKVYTDGSVSSVAIDKTCVVRVNSADTVCGFLDDKLIMGDNISRTIVSVPGEGLAINLEVDTGPLTSGVESEEMNLSFTQADEVTVDPTLGDFPLGSGNYFIDTTIAHTAIVSEISYVIDSPAQQDVTYAVKYLNETSKMLDQNVNTAEDFTLSHGFVLISGSSEQTEIPKIANINVDMAYIDTTNLMKLVRVVTGLQIISTIDKEIVRYDMNISRPGDIKPGTDIGLFMYICPGNTDIGQTEVAEEILVTSGTLYTRVNNMPLKESQIGD
jgi:hypothetical protein